VKPRRAARTRRAPNPPVIPGHAPSRGPESITTVPEMDGCLSSHLKRARRLWIPDSRFAASGMTAEIHARHRPPDFTIPASNPKTNVHVRTIKMKPHLPKLALAALLLAAAATPTRAEDAPAPAAAAAPSEAPASVPRPSIVPRAGTSVPQATQPAPATATAPSTAATDATPERPRTRRTAHRHHRRYGIYRAGYFGPFRFYWPQVHWPRVHWHRVAWRGWW
jgi:hypothetical protein